MYDLLAAYLEETVAEQRNDAHDYLPHCSLTGFFSLPETAFQQQIIEYLISSLTKDLEQMLKSPDSPPSPLAEIEYLYHDTAIGLAVHAPRIVQVIAKWSRSLSNPQEGIEPINIPPKERLHISMAYGDHVSRRTMPQLYDRALELETKRRSIAEPPIWKIALYKQEPHQRGRPREWMSQAIWTRTL